MNTAISLLIQIFYSINFKINHGVTSQNKAFCARYLIKHMNSVSTYLKTVISKISNLHLPPSSNILQLIAA